MNAEPNRNESTTEHSVPNTPGPETGSPTAASVGRPGPGYPGTTAAQHRIPIDDPRRKSTVLAIVLSLMPGLGQIYVGYYPRGFVHILVVSGLIAMLSSIQDFSPLFPMGMLFLFFFWLYNMIDAGRRAAMYNLMLDGGEVLDLPRDIRMPGLGGSIAGGIVVTAIGAIILSHTAYDFSLAWLENWWPAGVMIFGLYLVAKGLMERSARDRG
jgi:hypothetical protein